jgi:hypothetical protein
MTGANDANPERDLAAIVSNYVLQMFHDLLDLGSWVTT